jgi:hypothetical protein
MCCGKIYQHANAVDDKFDVGSGIIAKYLQQFKTLEALQRVLNLRIASKKMNDGLLKIAKMKRDLQDQ